MANASDDIQTWATRIVDHYRKRKMSDAAIRVCIKRIADFNQPLSKLVKKQVDATRPK